MAAPDDELPVWSFLPNWRNGVLERLSWLTDIPMNTYGPEQRRALRLSPRRGFEMGFNPVDRVRSYFDLFLHRLGSQEFMLPLFHDQARLTSDIVLGETVIPCDTAYREFAVGGMAIFIGDDAFTFNALTITDVAPDAITVETGVAQGWPAGTVIYPMRRSRLDQESAVAALTNRVGEATMRFELNQANDIDDEGDWDTLYKGYPVLVTPPNRREQIDLQFLRNSLLLDNDHGIREVGDDADRAFTVQSHLRLIVGRADHMAFRQFLYRLRGMQGPIWIPTFNRDLELSRNMLAANAFIHVKEIGYAYTGGAVSGRRDIMLPNGLFREITNTGAPLSSTEEKLMLNAALGVNLPAGTFGSFMEPCRLASDDIEITHHTDTDGAAEASYGFRAFRNERTTPDPISNPIAVAETDEDGCSDSERYWEMHTTFTGTVGGQWSPDHAIWVSSIGTNYEVWSAASRTKIAFGTFPGGDQIGVDNAGAIYTQSGGVVYKTPPGGETTAITIDSVTPFLTGCRYINDMICVYPFVILGVYVASGGHITNVPAGAGFYTYHYFPDANGQAWAVGTPSFGFTAPGIWLLNINRANFEAARFYDVPTSGLVKGLSITDNAVVLYQGGKLYRIDLATDTITHTVDAAPGALDVELMFDTFGPGFSSFFIGYKEYRSSDLTLLRDWGLINDQWRLVEATGLWYGYDPGSLIYDQENSALMSMTDQPTQTLLWLFLHKYGPGVDYRDL